MLVKLAVVAGAVGAVVLVITALPDIKRYIEISTM
jgi:hypothetical protein